MECRPSEPFFLFGIYFFKIQDIADIRPSKFINATESFAFSQIQLIVSFLLFLLPHLYLLIIFQSTL